MRCPNCNKRMGEVEPYTTSRGNPVREYQCPDCGIEIQEIKNPDAAGSNIYVTHQRLERIGATE